MVVPRNEYRNTRMIAWPVVAFFILAPLHLPIESIRFAPIKCGLTALSSAALLPLHPACPEEDFISQERMPCK
jgi:hypothetical protein